MQNKLSVLRVSETSNAVYSVGRILAALGHTFSLRFKALLTLFMPTGRDCCLRTAATNGLIVGISFIPQVREIWRDTVELY
jgi:hypothetical protein